MVLTQGGEGGGGTRDFMEASLLALAKSIYYLIVNNSCIKGRSVGVEANKSSRCVIFERASTAFICLHPFKLS